MSDIDLRGMLLQRGSRVGSEEYASCMQGGEILPSQEGLIVCSYFGGAERDSLLAFRPLFVLLYQHGVMDE